MALMNNEIIFLDTTLRDGEQTPGVNYFPEEKLKIARELVKLNIPIIEAGFPVASESDFKGVNIVAKEVGRKHNSPIICGLARANKKDIEIAAKALEPAYRPRVQILVPSSDIQIKNTMNSSHQEILNLTGEVINYALKYVDDVEFTALDACRSDREFLYQLLSIAIAEGAKTLEIPDTVGYVTPLDYGELISGIIKNVKDSKKVVIATHCHDDLGLATANTLAGLMAGARQAECTINGVGERAGNTPFEEVIMAIKTRPDIFPLNTSINTKHICEVSKLVEKLSTIKVQKNKAIVGKNAFLHASGMHQQGMLKDPKTFQIIDPSEVGAKDIALPLGKLSGKHALKDKIKQLKINLEDSDFDKVYLAFKDLSSKKKMIVDEDIINLSNRIKNKVI